MISGALDPSKTRFNAGVVCSNCCVPSFQLSNHRLPLPEKSIDLLVSCRSKPRKIALLDFWLGLRIGRQLTSIHIIDSHLNVFYRFSKRCSWRKPVLMLRFIRSSWFLIGLNNRKVCVIPNRTKKINVIRWLRRLALTSLVSSSNVSV